mmetsp:Transcript_85666/g.134639  ORF Transcript_85666/g.134639 Transcript_85666/m.134639 type:complete len:267 (+) Transcript_85666:93-893(+)
MQWKARTCNEYSVQAASYIAAFNHLSSEIFIETARPHPIQELIDLNNPIAVLIARLKDFVHLIFREKLFQQTFKSLGRHTSRLIFRLHEHVSDLLAHIFVCNALIAIFVVRAVGSLTPSATRWILSEWLSTTTIGTRCACLPLNELLASFFNFNLFFLFVIRRLATPCVRSIWTFAMRAASFVLAKLWMAAFVFAFLPTFLDTITCMRTIGSFAMRAARRVPAKPWLAAAINALWHTILLKVFTSLLTTIERFFPSCNFFAALLLL